MRGRVGFILGMFLRSLIRFGLSFQVNPQGALIFIDNKTGEQLYITKNDLQKKYEELEEEIKNE